MKRPVWMSILAISFQGACVRGADAPPELITSRGMVIATTGKGSAKAGVAALERGGTAMDAAMTVAMLQPCLAAGSYVSYAGILNLVYFEAATGKVWNLNAGYNTVKGETDPMSIPGPKPAEMAEKNFDAFKSNPSGRTALVPGFLAGVDEAQRRFGKLGRAAITTPALECARDGFALDPGLVGAMASRKGVLERLPETRAVFSAKGQLPTAGEIFRQPALAKTLAQFSQHGAREYIYRGAWAREFVAAVQADGGKMTLEDLAAYSPTWIEPVTTRFNGFDVYAHGLPTVGGAQLIEDLNLATAVKLTEMPSHKDSPLALYWMYQFVKTSTFLSAPGVSEQLGAAYKTDFSLQARLDPATAEKVLALIKVGRMPSVPPPKTTHHSDAVVAVDAAGNIAAVVHSINTLNWGSTGIFVGGISIPDSASFQQAQIATLTPGSRLPDSTMPGVVLREGKPVLGFSSIGSGLGPRTLAALVDVLGHGMTPHQAIANPSPGGLDFSRVAQGEIGAFVAANDFTADYLEKLRALGQPVKEEDAQRGYWIAIGIEGAGDTRRLHSGALREFSTAERPAGH
jgi:gamma-glutamyltranspeptidase / glutathione hydrolase